MAGLWYRAGTISVTNASKKVVGSGTLFKTTTFKPDKGHAFYGPDGKPYEIDYVESDTVLYLVKAYAGATASGQSYEIDITRTSTIPALSREISAQLAYAQGQYDSWQQIMTGTGDVTLTAPDGQTISVPALSNMLSKSGNLAGLAAPDTALSNLGLTTFGKAVAKAADASAGRTALGIGTQVSFDESAFSDFNDAALFPYQARAVKRRSSGFQPANRPLAASNYWSMETMSVSTSASTMYWLQRADDLISGRLFQRIVNTADSGTTRTYGAWVEVYSTAVKPSASDVNAYSKTEVPYESGTFTPNVLGGTTPGTAAYTTRIGRFTRVGNVCYVSLKIVATLTGAVGAITLSGLPFAHVNDGTFPAINVALGGVALGTGYVMQGAIIPPSASTCTISLLNQANGGTLQLQASSILSTLYVDISGVYTI